MVNFADRYEDDPEGVHPELVDKLQRMKEDGTSPMVGIKLAWLCRERRTDYFEDNWHKSDNVKELSDWMIEDVLHADIENEFDEIEV